jgi:hypothetical protein
MRHVVMEHQIRIDSEEQFDAEFKAGFAKFARSDNKNI